MRTMLMRVAMVLGLAAMVAACTGGPYPGGPPTTPRAGSY